MVYCGQCGQKVARRTRCVCCEELICGKCVAGKGYNEEHVCIKCEPIHRLDCYPEGTG